MTKLHILTDDTIARMESARDSEPEHPAPVPIQITPMTLRDGSHAVFALWFNDEAARCRACPAGTCTFKPSPFGVGTCINHAQGGLGWVAPRLSSSSGK